MYSYVLRRLLLIVPTMLFLSAVIFIFMRALPGDTIVVLEGDSGHYSPQQIAKLRSEWHMNDSLLTQYAYWLRDLSHGDLGRSLLSQEPVFGRIKDTFPITLELTIGVIAVSIAVGVPLGALSAIRRNSLLDYIIRSMANLGIALPSFWVGTLVLVLLSYWFRWGPPPGYVPFYRSPSTNFQQFIFPWLILATTPIALVLRMTRSAVLDVLTHDYIRTAYAKGLPGGTVLLRHVLRNSLIPVITILGTFFTTLIGGAVIIESIFSMPGIGRLVVDAAGRRDYPVVQGVILCVGVSVALLNLLVDLLYGVADPRVRNE